MRPATGRHDESERCHKHAAGVAKARSVIRERSGAKPKEPDSEPVQGAVLANHARDQTAFGMVMPHASKVSNSAASSAGVKVRCGGRM